MKNVSGHDLKETKVFFKHKKGDQTLELQKILNQHKNLILVLEENKKYQIADIIGTNFKSLEVRGQGSSFVVKKGKKANSILTLIDPVKVKIVDLNFSGNYPLAKTSDFLFKIHTPKGITKDILIENVIFKDADSGGLMIQNIYSKQKIHKWSAGADNIEIRNCKAFNTGLFAGFQIRGSHENVLIDHCFGTDPLARQHKSMGVMFGVSAEVGIPEDEVKNVNIQNCYIRNANKGFFAQKVKNLKLTNIHVDSLGHNPIYYEDGRPIGVVAIKIDDLGKGNKAVIDSFYVTNTANLPYRIFLALEESKKIGHTSGVEVKYFESDVGIRLGASGFHKIRGGILYGGSVDFLSSNNEVSNVAFRRESPSNGVKFLASGNTLSNSNFYNSNIRIFKKTKKNLIENCHLKRAERLKSFIQFDLNDPQDPNELMVRNCSAPSNVIGIWSGGLSKQSKNLKLSISNSKNLKLHKYLQESSTIIKNE